MVCVQCSFPMADKEMMNIDQLRCDSEYSKNPDRVPVGIIIQNINQHSTAVGVIMKTVKLDKSIVQSLYC